MNFSKITKANLVTEYKNLENQYSFAQGQAAAIENELIALIVNLLEVFKNAPEHTGLWGWIKVVWSSEFRTAIVEIINYLKTRKDQK